MQTLFTFLRIVAWIGGILGTLIVLRRWIAMRIWNSKSNELNRLMTKMRGQAARVRYVPPAITAALCWAWLLAEYFTK